MQTVKEIIPGTADCAVSFIVDGREVDLGKTIGPISVTRSVPDDHPDAGTQIIVE